MKAVKYNSQMRISQALHEVGREYRRYSKAQGNLQYKDSNDK